MRKKGVKIGNSGGLIRVDTVICYGVFIIIYWEHGNKHNNNKREASTGAGFRDIFLFPIFICHLGTTGNAGNKNWEQITKIGNKTGLFPEVGNAPARLKNHRQTGPPSIKKPGIATGLRGVGLKLFRVDNIEPFIAIRNAVLLLLSVRPRN